MAATVRSLFTKVKPNPRQTKPKPRLSSFVKPPSLRPKTWTEIKTKVLTLSLSSGLVVS